MNSIQLLDLAAYLPGLWRHNQSIKVLLTTLFPSMETKHILPWPPTFIFILSFRWTAHFCILQSDTKLGFFCAACCRCSLTCHCSFVPRHVVLIFFHGHKNKSKMSKYTLYQGWKLALGQWENSFISKTSNTAAPSTAFHPKRQAAGHLLWISKTHIP